MREVRVLQIAIRAINFKVLKERTGVRREVEWDVADRQDTLVARNQFVAKVSRVQGVVQQDALQVLLHCL